MLKVITLAAVTALALTAVSQPASAGNNGGAVAAGIIGGLAVGAIIGSQANRNYYSGPGYYEPRPRGFTKRKIAASFAATTSTATATSTSSACASATDGLKRGGTAGPLARPAPKRLLTWRISAC